MSTLFRFLSVVPLPLVHALGACLGWLAWACSPTYRRRFAANSRQAGYRFAQVRAAVGHAGRMVTELPRLWLRDTAVNPVHGAEVVEQAWSRGKGILFLTPHLGCFEITAQYYASHRPITVLYRRPKQDWLAPIIEEGRGANLKLAPADMGGVRKLIKALKSGEAVGMLPDQAPGAGEGEWVPFFGRPAYTMTLAARLAQVNATVLLAYAERLHYGAGYHLRLFAPTEALDTPAAINREIERLVRLCPAQYLWGYNRYKGRPQ